MIIKLIYLYLLLLCVTVHAGDLLKPEPARQKPYTKLWISRTAGKNIAKGLPVVFSSKCRGKKQVAAKNWLTDGKLINYFWGLDDGSVTWRELPPDGLNLSLDLGSIQPVDKLVLRCLGGIGVKNSHWRFPKQFTIYISKDGINYYKTAGYAKLLPAEKNQSNFVDYYYLKPKGYGYIYPFEFTVMADARYIGINIKENSLKLDELAVIASTDNQSKAISYNKTYSTDPKTFLMSGLNIRPQFNRLVISANMPTPNILFSTDLRKPDTRNKPTTLVMELPDGIVLEKPVPKSSKKITRDGIKYTRIEMPFIKKSWAYPVNAYFFRVEKNIPPGATARFYAESEGETPIINDVPVKIINIPEVKPTLQRLQISLAWMRENDTLNYPDFFKTWKRLGFRSVACFPREWEHFPKKGISRTATFKKLLKKARQHGFSIIMNSSPLSNDLRRGHRAGDEIFSQIPGKPNRNLCPSYRGKFYAKELARIAAAVRSVEPDYLFWDIEYWQKGAKEAEACTRCLTACKKSGKLMKEYLWLAGTEEYRDLYATVQRSSIGRRMPIIASYGIEAGKPTFRDRVQNFNRIYPDYITQSQPSLYVAGAAKVVHDVIRKNYQLLKKRVILPWLTAGTYGKYAPKKLEQMILEALLNGACGITYFSYTNFDTPLYFYYHAKALSQIAPYENIIMDGDILEPTGTNRNLTYSGIRQGNQMLLLIGNYVNAAEITKYSVPFKKVEAVKDLRAGKAITPSKVLTLNVPKGEIRLLYINGE